MSIRDRAGVGLPAWVLLPGLAYYAAFFVLPVVVVVVISLATPVGYGGVVLGVSGDAFITATRPTFLLVFARTLLFAAVGTVLVLLVAFPTAYWIARYGGSRKLLWVALLMVPFWTSFLLRAFAFLIVLGEEWFVVRAVRASGWTGFTPLGSDASVVMVLVYSYLPLGVLPIFAALERMDWRLVEAAGDLGASAWGAFVHVTVPTTARGVLTGLLLVFVPMTGEYVIPQIVGNGKTVLFANLIGQQFLQAQNWPLGSALALMLMAAVGICALLALRLGRAR